MLVSIGKMVNSSFIYEALPDYKSDLFSMMSWDESDYSRHIVQSQESRYLLAAAAERYESYYKFMVNI
jgi:hypothetical protein